MKPEELAKAIQEEKPQVIIFLKDSPDTFNVKIFGLCPKPEAAELIEEFIHDWQWHVRKSDDMPF